MDEHEGLKIAIALAWAIGWFGWAIAALATGIDWFSYLSAATFVVGILAMGAVHLWEDR